MPKKAREMTALAVSRLMQPGRWAVGGTEGLALQISEAGTRSWVLRMMVAGKRREMGLGGYPSVPLPDARKAAAEARSQFSDGGDAIAERRSAREQSAVAASTARTFTQCAAEYIEQHEQTWKGKKHAQQWRNTLATYVEPKFGRKAVRDVTTADVLGALKPIWSAKNETASRVRNRVELVWDWAKVHGYCAGENPARWRGHLDAALPSPNVVQRKTSRHHPAMPLEHLHTFVQRLRKQEGTAARCLEFAILCAARNGEARGARWSEVNLDEATWSIPGARMKGGKPHRVPLSQRALAILLEMQAQRRPKGAKGHDFVFPSPTGCEFSDAALGAVMNRMGEAGLLEDLPGAGDATPHGMRSCFRDWCSKSGINRELAERALSHVVDSAVEAAYLRTDLFEERRALMTEWARFIDRSAVGSAKVLPMRKRVAQLA